MDVPVCKWYTQIVILLKKVIFKILGSSAFIFQDPPKPYGIMTTPQTQASTKGIMFTRLCAGKKIQIEECTK